MIYYLFISFNLRFSAFFKIILTIFNVISLLLFFTDDYDYDDDTDEADYDEDDYYKWWSIETMNSDLQTIVIFVCALPDRTVNHSGEQQNLHCINVTPKFYSITILKKKIICIKEFYE